MDSSGAEDFKPHPHNFSPASVPLLDQKQEAYNSLISPWLGVMTAQTFTAGISGMLRFVEVNLSLPGKLGAVRMFLLSTEEGAPGGQDEHVLLRSEILAVANGWNAFDFSDTHIGLTVGRQYAILLQPLSACEWRVESGRKAYARGALFERWGDGPWEVSRPPADAAFRTYVEGFRSAASPGWGEPG